MNNRICELFSIRYPVIQGPMAWISTSSLVAAVSEAGGLGVLGVGFAPPDFVSSQIKETKALTGKPFGANVVLNLEMLDKVTSIIIEEKVPVIYADTLGVLEYAHAKKYFDIWHKHGIKVISKVGTVNEARIAEKAGADVIIAKGWEGGGHVSFESTMVLVPQAADAISVPLIASGGIGDGRGMAASIVMGADGIEMGSAFMLAEECTIHPNVKQAMINAKDMDTVVVGMATGEPCRQIKNKLSDAILRIEAENIKEIAAEKLKPVAESSLKKAMLFGDVENEGAVMAGQIVGLLNAVKPAGTIMKEMIAEYNAVLKKTAGFEIFLI